MYCVHYLKRRQWFMINLLFKLCFETLFNGKLVKMCIFCRRSVCLYNALSDLFSASFCISVCYIQLWSFCKQFNTVWSLQLLCRNYCQSMKYHSLSSLVLRWLMIQLNISFCILIFCSSCCEYVYFIFQFCELQELIVAMLLNECVFKCMYSNLYLNVCTCSYQQ